MPKIKPVADVGEGPGGTGSPPPLFRVEKEEMTEGRKAGWASKIEPGPLLQSLDPPLKTDDRKGTVFSYLVATEQGLNHTGLEFLVYFRISSYTLSCVFLTKSIFMIFKLGHFEANLFHRVEIVMQVILYF